MTFENGKNAVDLTRMLKSSFRKRAHKRPTADEVQLLWVHYLKRLASAEKAESETSIPISFKSVFARAVGDTITALRNLSELKERERVIVQAWDTISRTIGPIPVHAHHRTEEQGAILQTVTDRVEVEIAERIAERRKPQDATQAS